jgi:hypothetical protein
MIACCEQFGGLNLMIRFASTNKNTRKVDDAAELSKEDQEYFLIYQERCDRLRDRTKSVAKRYQNSVYIVGRPGSGKTHVIRETLEDSGTQHVNRNGRMSAMGLYEQLASHAESTIVIDDIPSLLSDRMALQILMAALGGEPGQPRPVTYSTKRKDDRGKAFNFSGGIIAVSNVPPRRDPLVDAFVSRSVLLEHEPTDEELAAVMRYTAFKGFTDMTPDECQLVVEFVINESRANDFRLDLRSMVKGFQDFRQCKDGNATRPWTELIRTSMKQILRPAPTEVPSKQEQIEQEREMVKQAMEKYPNDTKKQMAETGLKRSKFYSLRREIIAANGR